MPTTDPQCGLERRYKNMTKIKKHISISSDINRIILDYSNRCNITFSEAV